VTEFTTTGIHRVKAVVLSGQVIDVEDGEEKPTSAAIESPLRFSARHDDRSVPATVLRGLVKTSHPS